MFGLRILDILCVETEYCERYAKMENISDEKSEEDSEEDLSDEKGASSEDDDNEDDIAGHADP